MKISVSPRLTLLIISSLFLLPLVLAWLMWSGVVKFDPASTRNKGSLVNPTLPANWADLLLVATEGTAGLENNSASSVLQGRWVILYQVPLACGPDCQEKSSSLRQIHLAAGRHQSRVGLALLVPDGNNDETIRLLESIYSRFILITDPSGALGASLSVIQARDTNPATKMSDRYLIDPLGNIMMHYAADSDPNDIHKDLKRLLTWSKLDEK